MTLLVVGFIIYSIINYKEMYKHAISILPRER